jgi:predicted CxxxxCH...CXXCH cytochrome family protein
VCHQTPADALSEGHIDGATASVSFAGLGAAGVVPPLPPPTWDRASASCSSTYCHGATLVGGTHTTPVWTGGSGEAACDGCHGLPPVSAKHPAVSSSLPACSPCHALTIDASGAMIPPNAGGKHLDGTVEATGGHAGSWSDPASTDFHAFSANRGIANCTSCHGADLAGGSTGVACVGCHKAGGSGRDFATCTACHGGTYDASGAPPAATWGYAGDPSRGGGAADSIRVGAHRKHQSTANAAPLDCAACHVKPAGILSAGHMEAPTAPVTWGALAHTGGADPFWNRVDATCSSTYCHGNYAGTFRYSVWDYGLDQAVEVSVAYAGKKATPVWTGGPMTCDSCHGASGTDAGVWHSGQHANSIGGNNCELCHPDASGRASDGTQRITNPELHMNGTVEVTAQFGIRCFGCH